MIPSISERALFGRRLTRGHLSVTHHHRHTSNASMRAVFSKLKKETKARLSLGGSKEKSSSIDFDHPGGEPSGSDGRGDRKPIVYATAKLVLYAVKDSADAFPPLKSVVGGLCFILDSYEVCQLSTSPEQRP